MALGGAATWPLAARAQQPIPLVGYLSGISVGDRAHHTEAFRQGLNEIGYIEGATSRSSTDTQTIKWTGCGRWRPI